MTKIDAIVLAGGKNSPEMLHATGVENRALVEIEPGRTMLDYVTTALSGAQSVGSIYIVGDVPAREGARIIAPGDSLLDNILRGMDAAMASGDGKILAITSDAPFIDSKAVDSFLADATAANADFCYPIIPMDIYNLEFADAKRTTLKLRDGVFTGGNMMLLSSEYVRKNRDAVMAAYAARKDVLGLGKMLGWGLLFKIILSQTISPKLLSVAELEAGVSRLLGEGAVAKAIVTQHASIGADVDKPDDVLFARRHMETKVG